MGLLNKFSKWYFSKSALPYWCVLVLDSLILIVSALFIRLIKVGATAFIGSFSAVLLYLLLTLVSFVVAWRFLRTYSGILRFSSFVDLERVVLANITAGAILFVLSLVLGWLKFSSDIIALPSIIEILEVVGTTTLLMWMERVLVKTLYDIFRHDSNTQRVFIYGVRDGGVALAKDLRGQNPVVYDLKGFVAPDTETNAPELLLGVPVYKDDEELLAIMSKLNIKYLIVSPLQVDHIREKPEFVDNLIKGGFHIMMQPETEEWDGKSLEGKSKLKEVDIEDLLPREKIEVDLEAIGKLLKDQVVLITGAAGSIGSEMAHQVAKFHPKNLVLVDQAETPMHTQRLHMSKHYAFLDCETIVSSICNQTKMESIFERYKPDYVFHAAAYKHVPMMEDNPSEAVQNNIYGTRVIADLAVKYGTKKFVMISTDKAVNPTNVMGCSKRICEIYCQSLNRAIERGEVQMADGKPAVTQFITTRFGNVLGSNGSVIPLFKKQIAQGGPVTVTHPDIIRFFMLIPEACRLVLEAGTMGKGGEIFVFDMGKPVRIADLAQRMINLSGAKDVRIEFTGLRDGEKLYEEVLSENENTKPTSHPKIMVASVREYDYALALKNEEELYKLSFGYDDMAIVAKMKEIVPEYRSQHSKYESLDK